MIKLLIFDLDGTLIDSAPDIIATTNSLLVKHGRAPVAPEKIVAAIGEGLKQFVFSLFPETHSDPAFLKFVEKEFYSAYEENLVVRTTIYPGVHEFLSSCPCKIAIVTNKYSDLAQETIRRIGLAKYDWVRVFGADSLERRKPDPLPLLEVMKAAGVDRTETIMIGDGIPDMIAARRAGVHSLGIAFGYTSTEVLTAQGASLLLKSYAELPHAIGEIAALPAREILPE